MVTIFLLLPRCSYDEVVSFNHHPKKYSAQPTTCKYLNSFILNRYYEYNGILFDVTQLKSLQIIISYGVFRLGKWGGIVFTLFSNSNFYNPKLVSEIGMNHNLLQKISTLECVCKMCSECA